MSSVRALIESSELQGYNTVSATPPFPRMHQITKTVVKNVNQTEPLRVVGLQDHSNCINISHHALDDHQGDECRQSETAPARSCWTTRSFRLHLPFPSCTAGSSVASVETEGVSWITEPLEGHHLKQADKKVDIVQNNDRVGSFICCHCCLGCCFFTQCQDGFIACNNNQQPLNSIKNCNLKTGSFTAQSVTLVFVTGRAESETVFRPNMGFHYVFERTVFLMYGVLQQWYYDTSHFLLLVNTSLDSLPVLEN